MQIGNKSNQSPLVPTFVKVLGLTSAYAIFAYLKRILISLLRI